MLALPALIAAAALTLFAARYCARTAGALDADSAALARLRQAGAALKAGAAMQEAFEELPGGRLMDLAAVFSKNGFLPPPDERRQSGADLAPGWAVRREELAFRDAPVAAALQSCEAAESLRPPWRLTRLVVRASPQGKGRGQVLMSFEGIEASPGK
jgi:hypothetical protein